MASYFGSCQGSMIELRAALENSLPRLLNKEEDLEEAVKASNSSLSQPLNHEEVPHGSSASVHDALEPRRSLRKPAGASSSAVVDQTSASVGGDLSEGACHTVQLELATHFVLNWTILFVTQVVYYAFSRDPPRLALGTAVVATCVASIMHWSDVSYGGWRHTLDRIVSSCTLAWHLLFLHHNPATTSVHKYAAWACIAISSAGFALGWQQHSSGHIVQGMCCHLVFRFGAFWSLLIAHVNDRFSERDWMLCIVINSIMYVAASFGLWRYGKRINRV